MTKGAIAGIIGSAVLLSVFGPDLVTGSTHDHLPIAALVALPMALVSVGSVLMATPHRRALSVGAAWVTAALVGVFGPVLVTGSDPTRLPLAAILAPVVAVVITGFACLAEVRR